MKKLLMQQFVSANSVIFFFLLVLCECKLNLYGQKEVQETAMGQKYFDLWSTRVLLT